MHVPDNPDLLNPHLEHACPSCGRLHRPEKRVRMEVHSTTRHPSRDVVMLAGQVFEVPASEYDEISRSAHPGACSETKKAVTADVGALLVEHTSGGTTPLAIEGE